MPRKTEIYLARETRRHEENIEARLSEMTRVEIDTKNGVEDANVTIEQLQEGRRADMAQRNTANRVNLFGLRKKLEKNAIIKRQEKNKG